MLIWEVPGMTKFMLSPRHEALQGEVEVWLVLDGVVVHPKGAQVLEGSQGLHHAELGDVVEGEV